MYDILVNLKLRYNKLVHGKLGYELRYWRERYDIEGRKFRNSWYEELMLSIADEKSDYFLSGKDYCGF